MRRDFGIAQITTPRGPAEIVRRDLASLPFCTLTEFAAKPAAGTPQDRLAHMPRDRVLLVAPMSGHFAFILREMVLGFLPTADIAVTDWHNARFVPLSAGDFGFDENIETVIRSIERLGPGVHVCALCQAVVPTLAAIAVLAQRNPALAPRSLTLLGGPVDPLANPTRVVRLLRQRPLETIEASALDTVGPGFPGAGRRVYPASYQHAALLGYLSRSIMSGGELMQKVFADDGIDAVRFPFFDLFTSVMDLPAKSFLENLRKVFIERQAWTGELSWRGEPVDFEAISETALMTVEGARDDIAAPGQTSAAHRLCPNIPDAMRHRMVLNGAGHFSLFYGRTWRESVLPQIEAFRRANDRPRPRLLPLGQQAPLPFGDRRQSKGRHGSRPAEAMGETRRRQAGAG
jgi:poly(3-hydroxybutyrate) depolymerase